MNSLYICTLFIESCLNLRPETLCNLVSYMSGLVEGVVISFNVPGPNLYRLTDRTHSGYASQCAAG